MGSDRMKPDPTRNTRAAKYRAATKAAGGVRVDVHIGPEAAAVLARMRETMTVREAIETALIKAHAAAEMVTALNAMFPDDGEGDDDET